LYPLLFEPILKDYLWGGRTLETLGRSLPQEGVIAESWEIAAHEDGTTRVINGHFAGRLLTDLQAELGLGLIGSDCAWAHERGKFPLLIKLLDASRPLSVQVHPGDAYARAHEGNELGKTEMWVVLHAEPGARVQLGVTAGTTRERFRQGIADGNLEPLLHYVPVQAGDRICVPAGTLHAIMSGLLIAEIQQNSNTTYRVYDWNRVGADGRPRPLHVEKALEVINFDQVEPALYPAELLSQVNGVTRHLLCRNDYFVTERVELAKGADFAGRCDGSSLEIWGVIAGQASINEVALDAVQFVLLPAALGQFTVRSAKVAVLLRTYIAPSLSPSVPRD
jgi:mannose-6-phosphate isomerase